jgi:hypothetical protein
MKLSATWTVMIAAGVALSGCGGASDELPAACEAYLTRATACYDKAGAAAGQMKQGMEQVRAGWKAMPDKSQLEAACKAADEQFAQTATALGCQ